MRAWVVYMPPNLYYPWHYHPAEELYFCIAGEAYSKDGQEDRFHEGGIAQHSSNQSCMQTITNQCWLMLYGAMNLMFYRS